MAHTDRIQNSRNLQGGEGHLIGLLIIEVRLLDFS